ncbi:hypothetical protein [Myxococcus sp. NMCA1]|uniref:hypothetical protein n=1 Tax=Myxococcus sp. NMCA1 TaxID=2996785 RepID=UPI00228691E0|nr:hypothetical protein [Myxococcus sp. NMCA1]WAM26965.1 hypothetical protein OZ403_02275 [Myxococcus sp. NMCA1]
MKAQRLQVLRVDAEVPHLVTTAAVHSTASLAKSATVPCAGRLHGSRVNPGAER